MSQLNPSCNQSKKAYNEGKWKDIIPIFKEITLYTLMIVKISGPDSQFIQEQCKNLDKYCSSLESLFKEFNFQDKSQTDRLMIQLTLSVENLCKIAFPTPGSAEFFGMPKEATEAYADAILSMFESGRLNVRDVRLEEE